MHLWLRSHVLLLLRHLLGWLLCRLCLLCLLLFRAELQMLHLTKPNSRRWLLRLQLFPGSHVLLQLRLLGCLLCLLCRDACTMLGLVRDLSRHRLLLWQQLVHRHLLLLLHGLSLPHLLLLHLCLLLPCLLLLLCLPQALQQDT